MIFVDRQIQEKCQEMLTHLYTAFVDLTKAFDMVNRNGLGKVIQKFGCNERFPQMVHQLHDWMTARVIDKGTVSEAFAVTNGVKQGCVLAPTLFSLMLSAMLMDAYRDEQPGIRVHNFVYQLFWLMRSNEVAERQGARADWLNGTATRCSLSYTSSYIAFPEGGSTVVTHLRVEGPVGKPLASDMVGTTGS
ncbi:unnamed protein product [Schistocephalus solidus]|uniref:Reverse transcriptase domain-containing protein n=1 Tax=Schistocephalus solidus TaxID=70667 RepID=A0A183SY45_SCHSO|nr:unnamed protein product [Schistocephalus solidus]